MEGTAIGVSVLSMSQARVTVAYSVPQDPQGPGPGEALTPLRHPRQSLLELQQGASGDGRLRPLLLW